MARRSFTLALLAAFCFAGPWLAADDPKAKGQLPPNWKKLGLSDEQTQKIYKIQTEYRAKIDELEAKIKDLKGKEKTDMVAVLTPAQKARFKEIVEGALEKDAPTKDKETTKDKESSKDK